jgi:regulator of PEP synthase PpsR (kinase-PPPase family)
LPEVRGTNADENGGLIGTRSAYFDAIEALDFYARVDDGHEG